MTKILITGSAGFIGRHLAPSLAADGHEVLGLDRRDGGPLGDGPTVTCDLLDMERLQQIIREFAPEQIVHLAARTDLDEKKNLDGYIANTKGTINLIHAAKATPSVRRVIYTSSQLVCRYGYQPKDYDDYQPDSLYGQSKAEMEKIVRREDGGGVEWCLTRPTSVWGPGMGPHYRRFLRLLRKGRYFHIGNADGRKYYSYIGNIVYQYKRLLIAPATAIRGRTFYLSDYATLSMRDYADGLAREMHAPAVKTLPVWLAQVLAKAGDVINIAGIRRFPFNSFRLRNILTEYRPDLEPTEQVVGPLPHTRDEGIRETAKWFLLFEAEDPRALRLGGVKA